MKRGPRDRALHEIKQKDKRVKLTDSKEEAGSQKNFRKGDRLRLYFTKSLGTRFPSDTVS